MTYSVLKVPLNPNQPTNQAIMDGSKRSLSALRHALQLFKACLNKRRRGWDKITVLHAGCALHQGVLYHVRQ